MNMGNRSGQLFEAYDRGDLSLEELRTELRAGGEAASEELRGEAWLAGAIHAGDRKEPCPAGSSRRVRDALRDQIDLLLGPADTRIDSAQSLEAPEPAERAAQRRIGQTLREDITEALGPEVAEVLPFKRRWLPAAGLAASLLVALLVAGDKGDYPRLRPVREASALDTILEARALTAVPLADGGSDWLVSANVASPSQSNRLGTSPDRSLAAFRLGNEIEVRDHNGTASFGFLGASVWLENDRVIAGTHSGVVLFSPEGAVVRELDLPTPATVTAIRPLDQEHIAVGDSDGRLAIIDAQARALLAGPWETDCEGIHRIEAGESGLLVRDAKGTRFAIVPQKD